MPNKITVQDVSISIREHQKKDFISLTDIARYKDKDRSDYILQNWMRNRETIEFLGLWERINNENFNSIEFDGIRNKSEADILNTALFGMTAKQWKETNKDKDGNMRDYSSVEQLIVLSNMESINADRLISLNEIAISQMKSLVGNKTIEKLGNKA